MDKQSSTPPNPFAPVAPDAETLDSAKGHASDGDDGGTVTPPPEPHPLNL